MPIFSWPFFYFRNIAGETTLKKTPYVPGDQQDPFRSQAFAAAHVNLSERTLEAYRVKGGGPPYYKLGRRVCYRVQDLNAWAEAQRRTSTSE